MNIHQLSISYHAEQDRILVQINTLAAQELRLWLTRRLVIVFLPQLQRLIFSAEANVLNLTAPDDVAKKAVLEFKKQESIAKSDFKTPYESKATAYPIGKQPMLVTSIHLTPDQKSGLTIGFEEKVEADMPSVAPRGFQVTLESALLHGFIHLLESAIKASGWGLGETSAINTMDGATPTLNPDKPPYLN